MPVGYSRFMTDEDILEQIHDNIEQDPFIPRGDKDKILIEVDEGLVHLTGSVSAPEIISRVHDDAFWSAGVKEVENDLCAE